MKIVEYEGEGRRRRGRGRGGPVVVAHSILVTLSMEKLLTKWGQRRERGG